MIYNLRLNNSGFCYHSSMHQLIDVFDKNEKPTGRTATFDEVQTKGLFTQGVHIVIYTQDSQIVMQRRSPKLDYHPSQIEVSVGGGVVTGEDPKQAAIREIQEELGLKVSEDKLVFIGKKKFNHSYTRSGERAYKRSFDYFYKLKVTNEQISKLQPLDGEAGQIFTIGKRKLVWALRRHYLKGYGKFMPFYSYWALMVKSV